MAKRRRTILPLPEGGMCLAYSLGERTERGLCSAGKFGWRRGLEISKRGSALPSFLRDKSRAPGEFSVGALNRYGCPRSIHPEAEAGPAPANNSGMRRLTLYLLKRPPHRWEKASTVAGRHH